MCELDPDAPPSARRAWGVNVALVVLSAISVFGTVVTWIGGVGGLIAALGAGSIICCTIRPEPAYMSEVVMRWRASMAVTTVGMCFHIAGVVLTVLYWVRVTQIGVIGNICAEAGIDGAQCFGVARSFDAIIWVSTGVYVLCISLEVTALVLGFRAVAEYKAGEAEVGDYPGPVALSV